MIRKVSTVYGVNGVILKFANEGLQYGSQLCHWNDKRLNSYCIDYKHYVSFPFDVHKLVYYAIVVGASTSLYEAQSFYCTFVYPCPFLLAGVFDILGL